jgi:outer membrane protein TolC
VGLAANRELNPALEGANLSRARLDREAAAEDIGILSLGIRRRVQQQLMSCRSAHQELDIARRNLELAEGRAKLARQMFRLGRGDNFSVTDAEESLLDAENALNDAQSNWILSGYRLRLELGTLQDTPDDLKPNLPLEKKTK